MFERRWQTRQVNGGEVVIDPPTAGVAARRERHSARGQTRIAYRQRDCAFDRTIGKRHSAVVTIEPRRGNMQLRLCAIEFVIAQLQGRAVELQIFAPTQRFGQIELADGDVQVCVCGVLHSELKSDVMCLPTRTGEGIEMQLQSFDRRQPRCDEQGAEQQPARQSHQKYPFNDRGTRRWTDNDRRDRR